MRNRPRNKVCGVAYPVFIVFFEGREGTNAALAHDHTNNRKILTSNSIDNPWLLVLFAVIVIIIVFRG